MKPPLLPSELRRRTPIRLSELVELAVVFAVLGTTGFGGPTAHLIRMRALFVTERRWLDDNQFALMLGAANLIPGPTSTEFALHVGMRRAGLPGLLVAGIGFIVPAAVICAFAASLGSRWQAYPAWTGAVTATTSAVVALLAIGLPSFARPILRHPIDWMAACVGTAAAALGCDPLWTLFGTGLLTSLLCVLGGRSPGRLACHWLLLVFVTIILALWSRVVDTDPGSHSRFPNPAAVFTEFAAIGSSLYGNGNLLLAFVDQRLIERLEWIDIRTLQEATAVGQATPGPVFAMASFIGMRLAGVSGALAATVGIFLPAFLLVAVSSRFLDKLRESEVLMRFLAGLNAASVGTMALVVYEMGKGIASGWFAWAVFGISALCFWKTRMNVAWVIVCSAVAGSFAGWQMPVLFGM